MTLSEKQNALTEFCGTRSSFEGCDGCPLSNESEKWSIPTSLGCPAFFYSPENELDKAMKIAGLVPGKAKYWSRVCEMQKRQTEKGLNKYGQVLEDNTNMTIRERLEYLEEELIDGLMYLEHIKELLTKNEGQL